VQCPRKLLDRAHHPRRGAINRIADDYDISPAKRFEIPPTGPRAKFIDVPFRLAGIRVSAITASVYVLCGACAAFAGVVTASQLLAGSASVGLNSNLQSITAVILGGAALTGGVGGIPGTLVGVLLLGTIANGMALMQVQTFYQQIATGCVLLIAVGFGRLRSFLAGTS